MYQNNKRVSILDENAYYYILCKGLNNHNVHTYCANYL